jgi:hypothetical protein
MTLDEEPQHQSISGNDNEQENIQNNDGDNSENPWKKSSGNANDKKPIARAVVNEPAKKYAPPNVRGKKDAPDLKNEKFFPELGTEQSKRKDENMKKDGFEEVKHGLKQSQQTNTTIPLSLGNAYSTLVSNEEVDS